MRFYTTATNSRKKSVGTGGGAQGQEVHTRGWSLGVKIVARPEDDNDRFDVFMTAGSTNPDIQTFLGTARWKKGKMIFEKAKQ